MQDRFHRWFALGAFAFAIWLAPLGHSAAQDLRPQGLGAAEPAIALPAGAVPTPLFELLRKGGELESQRAWAEAFSHYESAIREYPHHSELRERLDTTRIRYDLTRRYTDHSFRDTLLAVAPSRAVELFEEVLLKIQAHYVQPPNWENVVKRGTSCVDIALYDEDFRAAHLRNVTDQQVNAFRRAMYGDLTRMAIRTRHSARDAVARMGRLAEHWMGISPTAIILEYVSGATGGLDDYSTYLTPDQLRDVYSQIEGNFVGLGIELKASEGTLLLVDVIEGSPAFRVGLRAGERITAVDGRSTEELTTDGAAALLQGVEGTTVTVTVLNKELPTRNVVVRRERVEVPSVEQVQIVDPDFGVGYFQLSSFQKTTTQDVDAALWKLHHQGMRSLVIDLRGNPGGLLTTSVEVADRFLTGGTIVETRGRSPQETFSYTARRSGTWRVPLVVLIDDESASASEIFASAIRDNHRGTVVGVRSYGKGSVQGIFPLSVAGAGVRLTTAKFYAPSGRAISDHGVEPDIKVVRAHRPVSGEATDLASSGLLEETDPFLAAGLRAARQLVAVR